MIGKKFGNRYEIKELLGSGGMSVVYMGLDTLLNRRVTIKVLRDQFASDADFVRRFHREAQAVASLSHINIVSIFDVGFEENLHYLVMEYVDGQNLKEYIRQQVKLPAAEALPITLQILDALQHAHEHGVVHRDIKPHNILLAKNGQVKVTDFGIARAVSEATVTFNGNMVGSVHYISPEQALGAEIGPQADIYGAGVVLYEMLTGKLPFTGDNPISVAMQHIQQEVEPPHLLVPEIPAALSAIVCRAMAKKKETRYQSAAEMRQDLNRFAAGRGHEIRYTPPAAAVAADEENTTVMPSLRASQPRPVKPRLKARSPWLAALLAVAVFLGLVFAGYQASRAFLEVDEVIVPQLVNKTLEQAQNLLDEAGLEYDVTYSESGSADKGLVISQSIDAGETVKKHRLVTLVVSKGAQMTVVPYVIGKTSQEAAVELGNKGLQVKLTEEFNTQMVKGQVIDQDPASGLEVPLKTLVTLKVSAGEEPKYITLPDLSRRSLEEAKKIISDNQLALGTVSEAGSDVLFAGQVISQQPAAGSQILQGDPVSLQVSSGPGPQAETVRVTYEIPDDGTEHRFQIVVHDMKGTRQEYDRTHPPGAKIEEDVPFYGSGQVELFLDGTVVHQQQLP